MVIEIKSIGCIEDLKNVPEKLGLKKGTNFRISFILAIDLCDECLLFTFFPKNDYLQMTIG